MSWRIDRVRLVVVVEFTPNYRVVRGEQGVQQKIASSYSHYKVHPNILLSTG